MSEAAAPLTGAERARKRFDQIVRLHAEADRIALQIRAETAALVEESTFAQRPFVGDELALALAESPGTGRRWVEDAQVLTAHPQLMALVGASVEDALGATPDRTGHRFSNRHADAVLDELAGASEQVQAQVPDLVLSDPSVRTPYQLRKATRAARLLHDLSADTDKQDRIHDRRSVTVVDELDGSASLHVNGRKTGAAA